MAGGGSNYLKRTEVSDANLQTGRYARLGSAEASDVIAKVSVVPFTSETGGGVYRGGVFVRYVDTSNWLMMVTTGWSGAGGSYPGWALIKRVAGTETTLASGLIKTGGAGVFAEISLQVLSSGAIEASIVGMEGGVPILVTDSVLATGGALEEGGFGIYDVWTSASAKTRLYDSFSVMTGASSSGAVCNSDKAMEIRPDVAEKEDPTGKFWSPVPEYRGSDFYLDPAGSGDLVNKLIVKMRRNDLDLEPDTSIADAQSLEVLARERWLAPR
jgi:hypothetical protein